MRCINCNVATLRLRRHTTSSLPELLLSILARWLTMEVPMDAIICHPCFELLNSERAGDARLFVHTMLCITCGHSVRNVRQRHEVERINPMMQDLPRSHPAFQQDTNYACHPCWMRYQRHQNQDQNRIPEPEPAPRPEPAPGRNQHQPEPEITLPKVATLS